MKNRAPGKGIAFGGLCLAALFFLLCLNACAAEKAPALTAVGAAPAVSALAPSCPMAENDPVEMPELVLFESEISPDWTVTDPGEGGEGHGHLYRLVSSRESVCARRGERVYRCDCGRALREDLPEVPHTVRAATCTEEAVCTVCGAVTGRPLGHAFEPDGDVCTRCGYLLTESFYVLGQEIALDEPLSSVREKLGAPTEIITEGDLVTYVYASALSRLTLVQGDAGGVWGVFSFDPSLRFRQDGRGYGFNSFSGRGDLLSEAELVLGGGTVLYGFRDRPGTGAVYAMWLRLKEYEYNFAVDDALRGDYTGQSRLTWFITNAQRARAGLRALTWSAPAAAVAEDYCRVIVATGQFDHDGSFASRLTGKGVRWRYAGENLSQGYFNCIFVCDAYFNSPDHRENILYAAFTHLGAAYVQQGFGTVYGAQEFYQAG